MYVVWYVVSDEIIFFKETNDEKTIKAYSELSKIVQKIPDTTEYYQARWKSNDEDFRVRKLCQDCADERGIKVSDDVCCTIL